MPEGARPPLARAGSLHMACTRSGVAAAYLPLDPVASRSPSPWVRDASPWRRALLRPTLRALALWGRSPPGPLELLPLLLLSLIHI